MHLSALITTAYGCMRWAPALQSPVSVTYLGHLGKHGVKGFDVLVFQTLLPVLQASARTSRVEVIQHPGHETSLLLQSIVGGGGPAHQAWVGGLDLPENTHFLVLLVVPTHGNAGHRGHCVTPIPTRHGCTQHHTPGHMPQCTPCPASRLSYYTMPARVAHTPQHRTSHRTQRPAQLRCKPAARHLSSPTQEASTEAKATVQNHDPRHRVAVFEGIIITNAIGSTAHGTHAPRGSRPPLELLMHTCPSHDAGAHSRASSRHSRSHKHPAHSCRSTSPWAHSCRSS